MFFYIGIAVALAAAFVIFRWARNAFKVHRSRLEADRKKREAQQVREDTIKQWSRKVMQLVEPSDIVRFGEGQVRDAVNGWKWYYDDFPAYPEEVQGYKKARRRLDEAKFILAFQSADQTARLDMLCEMLVGSKSFPSQLDIGFAKDDIAQMINDRVQDVRAEVATGELEAVQRYNVLRHSRNWVRLSYHGVQIPDCPEGWNDLVATHYATPSIETFDGFVTEPGDGHVRLWAAKALRTDSLMLGKVVLAYCAIKKELYAGHKRKQVVWPYRDEIGDVLLAEVTKMVHDIHVREGMFLNS